MTLLYGFLFASTFRASMFITVATKTTVSQDMAPSRALGPGDVHPAPMLAI